MKRGMYSDTESYRSVIYLALGVLAVGVITFFVVFGIYSDEIKERELAARESQKMSMQQQEISNVEQASTDIGKTVNEMENLIMENSIIENNLVVPSVGFNPNDEKEEKENIIKEEKVNDEKSDTKDTSSEAEKDTTKKEEKEPEFVSPLEQKEILRGFAKETLVYSETLDEWITHLGVDILAPKTTVVKASEMGKIESIKNDPRYGMTIIIAHNKGFKTIYSNLLSTEFVQIGDNVDKGESIGTIGNSAAFEIADESHLHFEIVKDNEKVDPELYIEF